MSTTDLHSVSKVTTASGFAGAAGQVSTDPVKVLFLHRGEDWVRGSENVLLTLLGGLRRDRVTPLLLSSNTELLERSRDIEAGRLRLPEIMIDGNHVRLQFGAWAAALQKICSLVAKRKIDLIYCNGGSTCQVGYYAAKFRRIPVICHVHSPYNRRYVVLYRIHRASKVIFVSKATQKVVEEKQHCLNGSEVVYNGIDVERFRPTTTRDPGWRERLSVPPLAMVFGQVASLIHRKGTDVALKALAVARRHCPNIHLVLIGDGIQRSEYHELARVLNITDRVTFFGNCEEPLPFYQHVLDAHVLASRTDAFGLSLLEAAACGLPNLASNVGGIPEAVSDGRTGILFPSEDHEALAEGMVKLARDANLRRALGAAGRNEVLERFSTTLFCKTIERHIGECVASTVTA